jgi:ubiquinone/menaquinone biosynthesis C-methylase UbiE
MHRDARTAISELYDRNVLSPHLEVGAGTCYSLAHCSALIPNLKLVLLDLNPHCLACGGKRMATFRPTLVQADVLQPAPFADNAFASIGLSHVISVLPCHVPGGKWQVFDHLARVLKDDGVLFGVDSLGRREEEGRGRQHYWSLAKRIRSWIFNRLRILDNEHDRLVDLEGALRRNFQQVEFQRVHGEVLFEARKPRRP